MRCEIKVIFNIIINMRNFKTPESLRTSNAKPIFIDLALIYDFHRI